MFRLHIDIPLSDDELKSAEDSKFIITLLEETLNNSVLVKKYGGRVSVVQYRLSRDEDRMVRNYLIKNENGHVSTNKSKITF